jgi:FixJ family two-component response regulator
MVTRSLRIQSAPVDETLVSAPIAGRRAHGSCTGIVRVPVQAPVICVVEEDIALRESLELLIQCEGWRTALFASARDFFAELGACAPSCLVVEADLDGLELQRRIAADRRGVPIIFVTDHCDVPLAVRAMKAGAIEFLTRPIDVATLLAAIRTAIEISAATQDHEHQLKGLRAAHASLSAREREVMSLVVAGMLNKQIGDVLGISEITVKAHRGRVMRKMNAASLADLVRMDAKLQADR